MTLGSSGVGTDSTSASGNRPLSLAWPGGIVNLNCQQIKGTGPGIQSPEFPKNCL